jgi:hypothetical protein
VILDGMMTTSAIVASAALMLTMLGVASARRATRSEWAASIGGPYRTTALARVAAEARPGERLVAAGGALLACAAGPALIVALVTLRWENIGVSLVPALLVVAARLYASLVTFRGADLAVARVIAHASLLLDVPLALFSIVHIRLIEDGHASLSLAVVAGTFALADGLQALLVLTMPSPAIRE